MCVHVASQQPYTHHNPLLQEAVTQSLDDACSWPLSVLIPQFHVTSAICGALLGLTHLELSGRISLSSTPSTYSPPLYCICIFEFTQELINILSASHDIIQVDKTHVLMLWKECGWSLARLIIEGSRTRVV